MKQKPALRISIFLNILLLILLILMAFNTQFYKIRRLSNLDEQNRKELFSLAGKALRSGDVPVGSLVLYDGEIIGKGFNTVYKDGNICGHAEVNALNNAIQKLGIREFLDLEREKLEVLSTFEPCEMCKGTLNHYRIHNLNFIRGKSYGTWIRNHWASFKYELTKRKSPGSEMQDSLFMLHPEYPGKK